ncbi:hypothetical protein BH10BAC3_BH10BAC3_25160 [soil metagenome]
MYGYLLRRTTTIIFCFVFLMAAACKKQSDSVVIIPPPPPPVVVAASILNTAHLEKLAVQVVFPNGEKAEGIYIYSDAPNYTPVIAGGEGFTCVDDVARVVLFYLRSSKFSSDTLIQKKVYGLLRFILNMQSGNGYFYNFLQQGNVINKAGITSINQPKWWSWRALQALTEAVPVITTTNALLADQANAAVIKLVNVIKQDLVNIPLTTNEINGIDVPQWLPEGADQAATMILGLLPYCKATNDVAILNYIRKLAEGIILMQHGDATHFPYSSFLSSGNTWHAYGNEQATAIFKTGMFLNDTSYTNRAMAEVNNFYPWLINNGFKNAFDVSFSNHVFTPLNAKEFEQIAYGIRPMVFAAIDAYTITNDEKYADMAGHLAAWFLGKNSAATNMFSINTGRCFDGINAGNNVNKNSGAESTIEALLTMQRVNNYPSVKAAMDKYKL